MARGHNREALDSQGRPATFFGGWNEYVNGKSHNLKVAQDYVRWLWIQNTKDEIDFNTSYGFHIPPRRSAVSAASLLQQGQAKVAVQIFDKYSHYAPILYSDASVSTPLGDAATAAVKTTGNLSTIVHQAAVKAQAAVNAEIK